MISRYLVLSTVTFLFFISWVAVHGQNSDKEPLYFQTYTIEDGLPDNWIRDVTQDQQGTIWIATASGLSKFDGYGFENYANEPGNTSSLSSNDAQKVLVDKENGVWVGTVSGLNRFNRARGTFQRFQNDPNDPTSLPGNTIIELHESRSGTLWVLTNRGLAAFEPYSQTFKVVSTETGNGSESSSTNLRCITESSDGRIWIGTEGEGIKILNPDTWEIANLRHDPDDESTIPGDFVRNLFIDQEEVLWVNYVLGGIGDDDFIAEDSPTGLWKKNLSTGDVYHYQYRPESGHLLFGNLTEFEQTKDGKLWFSRSSGTHGGLYRFNGQKNNFDKYVYEVNNPGAIAWNFVTAVFEDRFSNLWVAASRGLSRSNRSQIRMNSFTPNTADKYAALNNFYGIAEVSDNRFWISPDGGSEIIDWNRNTNTWEVRDDLKLGVRRLPVLPDDENHVWVANWPNSIQRLNMQTLEKTSFKLNSSSDSVVFINYFTLLQNGDLLVATDNGLWKPDIGSSRFLKVDLATPFVNNP
ncbi:MAG: two-component regulator propeller domain-containing protein, partial [Cryomorphaceae bacterium]